MSLRDLAEKLDAVAREHPEFSRVTKIIDVTVDHLCALARVSEVNQGEINLIRQLEELKRRVASLEERLNNADRQLEELKRRVASWLNNADHIQI